MSNKKIISELTLTTTENLVDEILFKTANTFLDDAIKSIPFASLITSSIQSYARFRTFKEQKQLLAFIQEANNTDHEFIEKFFSDKSNIELGFEILGILDQTYLERQARMIFRATKLFKDTQVTKQKFDKYTYIITKLNQHLISEIDELNNLYQKNINFEGTSAVPFQVIEFLSFGFIERRFEPDNRNSYARWDFEQHEYFVLDGFNEFYNKIFID